VKLNGESMEYEFDEPKNPVRFVFEFEAKPI
jgi:hypothetical protein